MSITIITDGSADLPQAVIQELGIRVVPLTVSFGDREYSSNIESSRFYDMMRGSDQLPKTSSPGPHAFAEAYRSSESAQALVICISSNISSTYHHATMGKELFEEERPDARIEVIDSKNASAGLGLLAYRAAEMAKEGLALEELARRIRALVESTRTVFVLDTLDNVIKGGRLDKVRGAIASMLNIKLVMRANEQGVIEVLEKARGSQNAIKRLIDKIGEAKLDFEDAILGIAHSNCEEKAKEVLKQIRERYPFRRILFSEMGPVIGTYAGEGGILVSY